MIPRLTKKLPKLLVIVGPTASGKSELALRLASWLCSAQAREKFDVRGAEIVSADSRQIYREMDVGTAKPPISPASKRAVAKSSAPPHGGATYISGGIPHHLVDIKNPNENYTVAEYKRDAIRTIHKIIAAGKLPIMVGGTGLYVKAVVQNLAIPKVKADPVLRRELEAELKEKGADFLMEQLISIDPEAAYIVDLKNPRRVIRALEIALETKKSIAKTRRKGPTLFETLEVGVFLCKENLLRRIAERTKWMIKNGLIQEVQKLVRKYGQNQKAFEAIGYREAIDYLNKKITKEKLVELLTRNTWQYARRQMTWFKKDPEIHWVKNEKEAMKLADDFLL